MELLVIYLIIHCSIAAWGVWAVFKFRTVNKKLIKLKDDPSGLPRDWNLFARRDTESWSFIQSLLGSVTIMPPRMAICSSLFVFGLIITIILYHWEDYAKRMGRRPKNMTRVPLSYKLYQIGISSIIWGGSAIGGLSWDKWCTFNDEGQTIDEAPPLQYLNTVICNHTSALDILVILATIQPGFVAKAGVKKMFVVGHIAEALDSVFVFRSCDKSRGNVLQAIFDRQDALSVQIDACKKSGKRQGLVRPLVIFPEGTTTSGLSVIPFRRGAFANKKAVVNPLILTYTPPWFNSGVFIPTLDCIDLPVLMPLLLSNWGHIRLNAYWYDVPGIIRNEGETTEAFMTRCHQFMKKNLESIWKTGSVLGSIGSSDKEENFPLLKDDSNHFPMNTQNNYDEIKGEFLEKLRGVKQVKDD